MNQNHKNKEKSARKYNLALYFFLTSLLVSSLLILFYSNIENVIIQSYRPKLDKAIILNNNNNDATYNWKDVSDTNVLKMATSRMSSENVNTIGIMTQPDAKVATTIANGVSDYVLNFAAGTLRPDQKMGQDNYVVAAHHVPAKSWALFSGIYFFSEPGQKVYFTDLNNVYEYTITNVKFVNATDVSIVDKNNYKLGLNGTKKGNPMVTIISCDSNGSKRITEYGTLTYTYNIHDKNLPKEAIDGFNKAADYNWK